MLSLNQLLDLIKKKKSLLILLYSVSSSCFNLASHSKLDKICFGNVLFNHKMIVIRWMVGLFVSVSWSLSQWSSHLIYSILIKHFFSLDYIIFSLFFIFNLASHSKLNKICFGNVLFNHKIIALLGWMVGLFVSVTFLGLFFSDSTSFDLLDYLIPSHLIR